MTATLLQNRTNEFLSFLGDHYPVYAGSIAENERRNREQFHALAERMLGWAETILGQDYLRVLADGYVTFVNDVNRSQVEYEERGRYEHSSYANVFAKTYDSSDFMNLYHWGVYVTTFAWEHHLLINQFFQRHFLPHLSQIQNGRLIDLGCGSGIWSLLTMSQLSSWQSTMVDISSTTTALTRHAVQSIDFDDRCDVIEADAITFQPDSPGDAAISCFLLEHVETPEAVLENLATAIPTGGRAFVTTALTAAETDHIFEFRRESEVLLMAEAAGFRVEASYSVAPVAVRPSSRFLPRSMALVLQKRRNEIW